MKSFTPLMLIAMVFVIGTVKADDLSQPHWRLFYGCTAISNTCTNPTRSRINATFNSCMCKNWTKQGNGNGDLIDDCD
ncbi:hypothetical protein CF328_g7651 [Tilletia controversa]|nr:hypothetical protein CF328_g7651 [Tilletia controversa]